MLRKARNRGRHGERLALSLQEVADGLGLSLGTVRTMVNEGRIPAVRVSARRRVVPVAAVRTLLAERPGR